MFHRQIQTNIYTHIYVCLYMDICFVYKLYNKRRHVNYTSVWGAHAMDVQTMRENLTFNHNIFELIRLNKMWETGCWVKLSLSGCFFFWMGWECGWMWVTDGLSILSLAVIHITFVSIILYRVSFGNKKCVHNLNFRGHQKGIAALYVYTISILD